MSKLRARVGMANMAKILLKAFNLVIIIKLIFRNIDKTLKYAHIYACTSTYVSIQINFYKHLIVTYNKEPVRLSEMYKEERLSTSTKEDDGVRYIKFVVRGG